MSELETIINKYFSKDDKAEVIYEMDQEEFTKMVNFMGTYEKPDILSIFDNKIIGIEHFEFDSYNNLKKGSDYQIKEKIIQRKMDKQIENDLISKKTMLINDKIENTSTLENYYNNFIKVFENHYKKIESYKEHIECDFDCKNKIIEFWFFIEDVTPLGNYFISSKGNNCLMSPLYSNEIIDLLKKSKKLKGIIVGRYAMNKYNLCIINNEEKVLEKFNKEKEEVTNEKFYSFDPQTTGFAILIPSQKNEKGEINE